MRERLLSNAAEARVEKYLFDRDGRAEYHVYDVYVGYILVQSFNSERSAEALARTINDRRKAQRLQPVPNVPTV